MNEEMQALLYDVPMQAREYGDDLTDLDREDVPNERIPRIKEVMRGSRDVFLSVRAGIVLASWRDEDGVSWLEDFVFDQQPSSEVLMPHRLRNYDDTCAQVLAAFVSGQSQHRFPAV